MSRMLLPPTDDSSDVPDTPPIQAPEVPFEVPTAKPPFEAAVQGFRLLVPSMRGAEHACAGAPPGDLAAGGTGAYWRCTCLRSWQCSLESSARVDWVGLGRVRLDASGEDAATGGAASHCAVWRARRSCTLFYLTPKN